jgi:hypothetical protein
MCPTCTPLLDGGFRVRLRDKQHGFCDLQKPLVEFEDKCRSRRSTWAKAVQDKGSPIQTVENFDCDYFFTESPRKLRKIVEFAISSLFSTACRGGHFMCNLLFM